MTGDTATWPELIRIADDTPGRRPGRDSGRPHGSGRPLLLLLPLLRDPAPPPGATASLATALITVGAPRHTAPATARHLLDHSSAGAWHDSTWASPLSGGTGSGRPTGGGLLARLGLN